MLDCRNIAKGHCMLSRSARPAGERTIIVVDNDTAVLGSLKFALETDGFDVLVFRSGEDVLADNGLPESACLVVDYHLSAMNGLELVDALRERGVTFPAVLMTFHPSPDVRQAAARRGLELVEKPLLDNALTSAIMQIYRG